MARLLKIENWARTYSFGPRKISFTSKSAEFNCQFNRLVYGGPRSTDQRKKWWQQFFSWAKNGPRTTFFLHLNNTKFEWFFLATRYLFSVKSTQEDLNFSWSWLFWPPHVVFSCQITSFKSEKREREKK